METSRFTLKQFVKHTVTEEIGFICHIDTNGIISVQLPYIYDDKKPHVEAMDAVVINQVAGLENEFESIDIF